MGGAGRGHGPWQYMYGRRCEKGLGSLLCTSASSLLPLPGPSNTRPQNAIQFNSLRHADHHSAATRAYPHLRNAPAAPTFPAPLTALGLAAFVPPLWGAIMDKRGERAGVGGRALKADVRMMWV